MSSKMDELFQAVTFESVDNFEDIDDMTLSQALDKYEVEAADITYGRFTGVANWMMTCEMEPYETGVRMPVVDKTVKSEPAAEISAPISNDRFGDEVSAKEVIDLHYQHESKNTRRNTSWAIKVFNDWMASRKTKLTPLLECSDNQLNEVLTYFVMEARRADGKDYPPKTLYSLCSAILRHMRENGVTDKNLLEMKDARFLKFRKTLDVRMKQLSSAGIGVTVKQADPITSEQEALLWDVGKLGKSTSQAMINTVFYYNCKLFSLRGYDEHRALETSQFKCGETDGKTIIEFQGRTSKNFAGGLHQRNVFAKNIRHFSDSGHERSVYDVYSEYLALVGDGPMYRRPLAGDKIRFENQPIGVNKLGKIIKNMCSEAGIDGNFSNHSGKRTCATSLFQAGIDEQMIMARTGHRSTAVRAYKRPCETQLREVSRALEPGPLASAPGSVSVNVAKPKSVTDDDKENKPCGIPSYINIQNCQVSIITHKQ